MGAGGATGLRIVELPVPLIYLDEKRSFGGALDDADTRLAVYRAGVGSGRAGWRDKDQGSEFRVQYVKSVCHAAPDS